jgi:glycosyltransferase involved in cell wall biosynthesis
MEQGGEDSAFEADVALLRRHGHFVAELVEDSSRIGGMGQARLAARTIWSTDSRKRVAESIEETHPDVIHFHNTFPLLSPSVYSASASYAIPVVQTLHNFRLLCPNGLFYRDGHVCEDCMGRFFPWPGVLHACYRRSRPASGVVAAMLSFHRLLGTWEKRVDTYIVLTNHAKEKFIQGGLPKEKVVVRPNFVDPDPGGSEGEAKPYALFVGRLSQEKGVRILLTAWGFARGIPLVMIGDGPLSSELEGLVKSRELSNVKLIGHQPHPRVLGALKGARFLIVPSVCHEAFSLAVVEAFAAGVPVVASRLGAMAEIVDDRRTGLLFEPGNAEDLADKVKWLWSNPDESEAMGREARREFEQKYTAEQAYQGLMAIYSRLIAAMRGNG